MIEYRDNYKYYKLIYNYTTGNMLNMKNAF